MGPNQKTILTQDSVHDASNTGGHATSQHATQHRSQIQVEPSPTFLLGAKGPIPPS